MKILKSLVMIAGVVVLMSCFALAQASRTWVSGVGSDSNPCTRSQPCQTFAGAIAKTAAGGEIDALDGGGFDAVTITKAITIDGGGGTVASILANGTNGIVVQAGASDTVTIRNLRINGLHAGTSTNGILFQSGKFLHIENCVVTGFTNHGIWANLTAAASMTVENTISRDNASSGLRGTDTAASLLVNVIRSSFSNNQFGLWMDGNVKATVTQSDASLNYLGFIAQGNGGTAVLNLAGSNASNNSIGVQAGGGSNPAILNLTNNTIFDNGTGIVNGNNGTTRSWGNNSNKDSGTPNGQAYLAQ